MDYSSLDRAALWPLEIVFSLNLIGWKAEIVLKSLKLGGFFGL
jgi:hypothetical protein